MKKPYMRTIIGSSEIGCVLIILFQLYGSKTVLFESNLFWVGQYYHHPTPPTPSPATFVLEEELVQY